MTNQGVRRGFAAGLIVAMSVAASSAVSAQTKIRPGFNLFSAEQDSQIGRRSAAELERQLPILREPSVEAYVGAIGTRLAGFIPGRQFRYQFRIVNTSEINAFALPGGYVYLSRGVIEAAKNEGQLAGFLAHEMSHVALRHGTNQASKVYLGQAGLGMLGGLPSRDDESLDRMIDAAGGFGLNALFLKFGSTDEEQADIAGAQTLARAGWNPQDMVEFFEVLRAKQSTEPEKVAPFFSDHPAPRDRATRIRNEMKLLTIRPSDSIGGLKQAKATLTTVPAAASMQQIARNTPAAPPRAGPVGAPGGVDIGSPSSTFQKLEQRGRSFQVEYPSNWRAYESADGLGVTLAPDGGLVDAGGQHKALIYGVVLNHYTPFLNDMNDVDGRVSFPRSAGATSGGSVSATHLDEATNDLVSQIVRTNSSLKLIPGSARNDTIDGSSALSLVLSGRSAVTGAEERVTVVTREFTDSHVVYALFIAPGQDDAQLHGTLTRMMASLRLTDDAAQK